MAKTKTTAISPLTGKLPTATEAQVAASRLLHDHRLARACQALDPTLTLGSSDTAPDAPLHSLRLRADEGELEVVYAAPERPSLGLLASDGSDSNDALHVLAAEVAFGPALAALGKLGLHGIQAVGVRPHSGPAPEGRWCVLRRGGEAIATFQLAQAAERVYAALEARLRMQSSRDARLRSRLALPGRVCLAERRVRRAVIQSLEQGDVLLLEVGELPGEGACTVRFGSSGGVGLAAEALVEDASIILQGVLRMSEDKRAARDSGRGSDGVEAMGNLEIPVRFEIETRPVPLSELEAMGPGAVIPLTTSLASAKLQLIACGQVVGEAELVAVGDRLGARIIRMAVQDEQPVS
jgi:type III secretion protein Q